MVGQNYSDVQFINGLSYPFNQYRDRDRDFSPFVELPCDYAYKIRVYNYDNGLHYVLIRPRGDGLIPVGTEVVCFSQRHQLENERKHGNFLRWDKKGVNLDPIRLTIREHSNQKDYGIWYKMEEQTFRKGIYNIGYCFQIEKVYQD